MNPDVDCDFEFNSKFESGNLDMVVQSGPNEFDCFMRVDSNTIGHIQWFYFSVANVKAEVGTTIRLNLVNFTKKNSLY